MGSDLLFGTPSFLTGMARCVDLFGSFDDYNISPNGQIADAMAARADWNAVGGDLNRALDNLREKEETEAVQLEVSP